MIPYVGNAISERIVWGQINGDIKGGTSVASGLVNSLVLGVRDALIDKRLLAPLRESTKTPDVLGFWGALKTFAQRDEIALQDKIYFGIMDIAKLPKSFNNLDDLNNQMAALENYVKADPDYFTGTGGGSAGAQFFEDYKLFKMSPQRRQGFLMDKAGLNLFEIHHPEKYPDKAG